MLTKMQTIPVDAVAVLLRTMPPVGSVAGDSPVLGRHAFAGIAAFGSAVDDGMGARPRGVPV